MRKGSVLSAWTRTLIGLAGFCVSIIFIQPLYCAGVPTVILDPGHGGSDRGVIGKGGMTEKEVTLDLARRVRDLIDQRLGYRTVLTREEDQEVSLDERAARANNQKGTLLVSIHLGSSFDPQVRGYGIYTALSSEERRGGETDNLPRWDRQYLAFSEQATRLAESIHRSFSTSLPQAVDLGIRPLSLYLARAVRMPAVLIESAVLSNGEEEEFLCEEENRQVLAEAIFQGLVLYWQPDEDRGEDE